MAELTLIVPLSNFSRNEYFSKNSNKAYFQRVYVSYNPIKKFQNDKFIYTDDRILLIFDAVIFNSEQVLGRYHCKTMQECLADSYKNKMLENILRDLRGSFVGIIYDSELDLFEAFVDPWASRTLFYWKSDKVIIVSSEVSEIVASMKRMKETVDLNYAGVYSLMTYAYMFQYHTLIEGVYRLKEGEIIRFDLGAKTAKRKTYFQFSFKEEAIQEKDAIERVDELFRHAVKIQLDKNQLNGLNNYIPLSAGLDSRMVSFVAASLGANVTNFTYSSTNGNDFLIPGQMAEHLHNRWLFKSLDNGLDLLNIDESSELADGLIYYAWPAQLNDFMRFMNVEDWGLIHTGVIGDVIPGSFYRKLPRRLYKLGDGAYSTTLLDRLKEYIEINEPMDYEYGMFQNRAINGAALGYSTTFRRYTEAFSPFMDIDFASFCFSLPISLRMRHKLYYNWVLKKYPDAAKFPHNGVHISADSTISFRGKSYRVGSLPSLIVRFIKSKMFLNTGMNPNQYWYESNITIQQSFSQYFNMYISVLDGYPQIQKDCMFLYNQESVMDKILAISLISSIKKLSI